MIYLTGSNGFVGKNFKVFLKKKKKLFIKLKRTKFKKDNYSNYTSLPFIKKNKNDCLVHLSSPSLVKIYRTKNNSKEFFKQCLKNELGNALSLIEFCKKNKFKKIIYFSTSSVYGPRDYKAPFSETDNPYPKDHYAKIKLNVENFIKKRFENTIIVRPFQIYGKFDNPKRLIPTLIKAKKNQQIYLQNCLQVTDLIYIDDLCSAIYKIINSKIKKGIFNLGSGKAIEMRQVVELIHSMKNKKFNFYYKKSSKKKITNYCYANINFTKKILNWKPKVFFNQKSFKLIDL